MWPFGGEELAGTRVQVIFVRGVDLVAPRAGLCIEIGEVGKSKIIDVDGERIASVVGDGNAVSAGIAVIPRSLLSRVLQVRTMTDAIHRLAKTGDLRAVRLEREPASGKPRLARITGDCPACGLGPNSQLFYEDAAEPLRPTRQIDGKGHITLTTYTSHGQPASRTEAAGTPQERTTSWEYDPVFPAFVAREERPSTAGGAGLRVSEAVYDTEGNASPRTISGAEAGSAFSFATTSLFNAAGQPLSIDPPGHGTADARPRSTSGTA